MKMASLCSLFALTRQGQRTLHIFTQNKCTASLRANRRPTATQTQTQTQLMSTSRSSENKNQNRNLPDYGTTPIEVDQIRLEKIKKWRRKDLDGQSLIEDTMKELETDVDFQLTAKALREKGAQRMSLEERKVRRRALDALGVPDFKTFVTQKMVEENTVKNVISRKDPTVFQLNIGLYCNQACSHCHVESSPQRQEMMSVETATKCLELLKNSPSITTLDITGGAPELNDNFRLIVRLAREMRPDVDIIDRCNLTVLHEPGQEDLVQFLKEHSVHVIASLPCYGEKNVNQQRGKGVFDRSISALLMLNEAGYGVPGSGLELDLVYNPLGAFLPPEQAKLEVAYKERLDQDFGVVFNQLYTMTNMPVKRFADFLHRRGELKDYMDLLVRNFNLDTTDSLMCRDTVSIGYDGKVFDCDFNQQLGYGLGTDKVHEGGKTVFDIETLTDLKDDAIVNDNHCFGCTAGMGSS
mmetsp:Transcript_27380/g.40446  ORF Transcript_27380/g.40446 Transcript_27380/m.40446 type:complete len:468 (-) Transcript_27380:230-1633(-)